MDPFNKTSFRINRLPLPSLSTIPRKPNRSENRFKSLQKKYATENYDAKGKSQNTSFTGEGSMDQIDEYENKCSSGSSITDLPTTANSSKLSQRPTNRKNGSVGYPKIEISARAKVQNVNLNMDNNLNTSTNKGLKETSNNFYRTSLTFKALSKEVTPPKVSSKAWVIMDAQTERVFYSSKGNIKREIASLTKMMTCLCVCKLIKQFEIDPQNVYIQVSRTASEMKGTSAKLQYQDILSIWELMHGLMLPSGNDAAVALAENFGTYIYLKSELCKAKTDIDPDHPNKKVKNAAKYFLTLMNKTAYDLGLSSTYYATPHGLNNMDGYSTANDQAKLSLEVLKYDMIMEIVDKPHFTCEIEQGDKSYRMVTWENTNKLLGKPGWHGIKTGVTTAAGPSLSAYYKDEKDEYIIILLGSISMDIRWTESQRLVKWANKLKEEKQY